MHHYARGLEATRDTAWALDGAGRAAARPPQRAREHDLPAVPLAARGRAGPHLRAGPGSLPRGRPSRLPYGRRGKAFGVTLPAVTHLVDRLEQKGFVTRAGDPGDRRAYVLEGTRPGGALVDELHAMRLRGLESVLARMSADNRTRVVRGLEALVEASLEVAAG